MFTFPFKAFPFKISMPPLRRGTVREYRASRGAAQALVEAKVQQFLPHYKVTYKRLTVRNQKTRWGSCSRSGSLSFNYRILFLTPELQDYLIVHELCHLREFNHSQAFWNLVGEKIPNYRELRKKLRHMG